MPEPDLAAQILHRQGQLEAQRATWENLWRQVAAKVLPRQNIFQRGGAGGIVQGERRDEQLFDSTAPLALERFAAAMEWMLIPRSQTWHKLAPYDKALKDDRDIKVYLDQVTQILFDSRYSPRSNFASQAHESFMSLGAFGTGTLFIDDALGDTIRYRVCHLAEIFFAENHVGVVDTVHRKFPMTARQILQRWPNTAGADVRERAQRAPDQEMDIIHAVQPRSEVQTDRRDYRGMPIASCYLLIPSKTILEESGYWTFPYAVSRYVVAPRETYGRSPAITVFADISMVNEQRKTDLRARQRAVDPATLLPEDGALQAFDLRAGALNFGGVDDQGRIMAHPYNTGARLDLSEEGLKDTRQVINDAFLVTLFQILVETPQMTATEALLRAQEKGALLAPTMGRQQSEMLGPLIERELDILARAGQLPPMPPALARRGGHIRIEYVSPLNRMQRAEEGVGILRTLEAAASIVASDPSALLVFDADATLRELAEINGMPAKLLRAPEVVAQMKQQAQQAQAIQSLIAAAPGTAGAIKDLSAAAQTAGNQPQPQPGVGGSLPQ